MAGGRRRKRLANSHEISNLGYGHYGTPRYNEKEQAWHFQRSVQGESLLDEEEHGEDGTCQLQLLHLRVSAFYEDVTESPPVPGRSGRHVPRRVLKAFPEFAGAAGIITDVEYKDASDESIKQPSTFATQTVFARAPHPITRHYHAEDSDVPFVASVGCEDRAALKLSLLQLKATGHSERTSIEVQESLPILSSSSVWSAPLNEPILQLCYNSTSSILAYRQTSASTLCLPFMDDSQIDASPRQRVALKPILSLPNKRTGGHPHADIALTSFAGLRLGIVDTHGNWSIWGIGGKRALTARLLHQAILLQSRKLWLWTDEYRASKGSNPYLDGWHKICLSEAADGSSVTLVANRHGAMLYDAEGQELENVNMRLRSSSDWLLDMWVSATEPSICIALSMSRVLLLRIENKGSTGPSVQLICSCNHFLGRGDVSLRLSALELPDAIHIFLYPRRHARLTLITFSRGDKSSSWAVTDPKPFQVFKDAGPPSGAVTDVFFLPIQAPVSQSDDTTVPVFIKVVIRARDGQLSEAFYRYLGRPMARDTVQKAQIAMWPDAHKRKILSSQIVDDEDEDMDNFIAGDDIQQSSVTMHHEGEARRSARNNAKNWSWIFDTIKESSTVADISGCLEQAKVRVLDNHNLSSALTLLRELITDVRVDDVEEAEEHLAEWANGLSGPDISGGQLALKRISETESTGLLDIYNKISSHFVEPLSERVADRLRVNTERLSRQAAMDVTLSSVAVQRPQRPLTQLVDEDMEPIESNVQQSSDVDAARARLSKYTTFSEPNAAIPSSSAISDMLSHLPDDISADPEQYSYGAVELDLARRRLQARELDPAAKRLADRLEAVRRKRAEKATATGKLNLSQETPVVVRSSSPASEQRAMTQTERGDFGARPLTGLKAGKKKPKTAGF